MDFRKEHGLFGQVNKWGVGVWGFAAARHFEISGPDFSVLLTSSLV